MNRSHIPPSTMGASNPEFMDPLKPNVPYLPNPQLLLLEAFVPGFSIFSAFLQKHTSIDLQIYIPAIVMLGVVVFAAGYINSYVTNFFNEHLMSTADVRIDDEMYNMLMAWIANQKFAKQSRRFVANTNLNSRMWWLFRDDDSNEDDDEDDSRSFASRMRGKKDKKVQFTPSFGTHFFWYRNRPMIFRRTEDTRQTGYGPVSERENISVSSFGRNPYLLKELLDECRQSFSKSDENRTVIYRGGLKPGSSEPAWTRCVSRVSRPFSTVVLDEGVKTSLLQDMVDYLGSRKWYNNRGIPYRRGYLLWGPPGTGKSSLSFAIAGYFKLKIYIVSLNSMAMNEENLGSLFAELPKQCVVLLEDIDTAGLTHTREPEALPTPVLPQNIANGTTVAAPQSTGKVSLSALLNIIDGVAATEGRILIMTTNHLDKLDDALIRPGRVDMTIKFDLANSTMIETIFRGIFATLEGDMPKARPSSVEVPPEELAKALAAEEVKRQVEEARIERLSKEISAVIPGMTFSPAEIQGYFLKWKREPERAVEGAVEWVTKTKVEKARKEREEKEKRQKEKEEREKEEKEAKEKEKKEKEEEKKTEEKTEEKEKLVNGVD